MSSPNATMTCLRVDGRTCWIRVAAAQSLALWSSDAFALAALTEPLHGMVRKGDEYYFDGQITGPLGPALEADTGLSLADACMQLCEQPSALAAVIARYVTFRGYRDITGLTIPAWMQPNAEGLYVATKWPASDEEQRALGMRHYDEIDAWYKQDYAYRYEDGPPPTLAEPGATLVLEATKPEWLAHMVPGASWDSYCWDNEGPSFP
jgi:hypothetical protein